MTWWNEERIASLQVHLWLKNVLSRCQHSSWSLCYLGVLYTPNMNLTILYSNKFHQLHCHQSSRKQNSWPSLKRQEERHWSPPLFFTTFNLLSLLCFPDSDFLDCVYRTLSWPTTRQGGQSQQHHCSKNKPRTSMSNIQNTGWHVKRWYSSYWYRYRVQLASSKYQRIARVVELFADHEVAVE